MENNYSIVKVRCCHVNHFSAIISNGYATLRSYIWNDVAIHVPATLSISETIKNGERMVKSTLKFDSMMDISHVASKSRPVKNFCYEVTCADGTRFLIGTNNKPYAQTTFKRNLGSVTSNQAYQYQVTLDDNKPVPIIR